MGTNVSGEPTASNFRLLQSWTLKILLFIYNTTQAYIPYLNINCHENLRSHSVVYWFSGEWYRYWITPYPLDSPDKLLLYSVAMWQITAYLQHGQVLYTTILYPMSVMYISHHVLSSFVLEGHWESWMLCLTIVKTGNSSSLQHSHICAWRFLLSCSVLHTYEMEGGTMKLIILQYPLLTTQKVYKTV